MRDEGDFSKGERRGRSRGHSKLNRTAGADPEAVRWVRERAEWTSRERFERALAQLPDVEPDEEDAL